MSCAKSGNIQDPVLYFVSILIALLLSCLLPTFSLDLLE